MAMLSLLGDRRIPVRWEEEGPSQSSGARDRRKDHGKSAVEGAPSPQPATPYSAPYGAIAATRMHDGGSGSGGGVGDSGGAVGGDLVAETSILLWNSNGTFDCTVSDESQCCVVVMSHRAVS